MESWSSIFFWISEAFFFFADIADTDSRPWDYQAEESSLRSAVDRFNHRRYQREIPNFQQQSQMQQSQEQSPEHQLFGTEVHII